MAIFNVEFLYHKATTFIIEKTMRNLTPGDRFYFQTVDNVEISFSDENKLTCH